MANGTCHAVVWGEDGDPAWWATRTRRALEALGLTIREARGIPAQVDALRARADSVWLVRAGAWPVGPYEPPPRSATGRPLFAFGAVLGDSPEARTWRTPRDLERQPLPAALSVWVEGALASDLGGLIAEGLANGLLRLRDSRRPRVVRAAAIDVAHDAGLRAAQIVTSLQQGGAERVALELARALPSEGVTILLAVLGAPTREAFTPHRGTVMLTWERRPKAARTHGIGAALVEAGVDVAHAHLLDADEIRLLSRTGLPVVVTLHNQRPGWPSGTESLRDGDARLVVACSRAVESDVRAAGIGIPCRTVWNGIDFGRLAASATADGVDGRAGLGLGPRDFVILALANPRRQKRLERLPEILHQLRGVLAQRGIGREARLVVAGAPSTRSVDGSEAQDELLRAVDAAGVREQVRLPGSVTDVGPLIRAADVLVSTSAHEGLALAHLEALACDVPVVATAVGGAPEVAAVAPGVTLVPAEAGAAVFAAVLADLAGPRSEPPLRLSSAAEVHFDLSRMAQGYARLLRSAARTSASRSSAGLLLIANNFSTGGAQSSARRLLLALHQRGVSVRAAVIQEQPAHPTSGRRALEAAGVPVLSVSPPPETDPAQAVERLLEWTGRNPPEAIVLWNVIVEHKVLIAETVIDVPVFDVSPGEMYFESLERYFERPRPGLACTSARQYGARLAGVVVKYADEAERARALVGAPVHVIPNGVDLATPRVLAQANGRLTIGTLARLDPRKHVERLLRALRFAAARLPPHVLKIAGGPEPGPSGYLDTLRGLADGLAVEFVGEVEPGAFLGGLDLFALVAEPAGCPNASLEAMARGLPVVATDAGGMREQIEDGVTGRLVPREDEEALALALVDLGSDPEARRRLGSAGRERVRERFSMDAMADAYLALLPNPKRSRPGGPRGPSPDSDAIATS